MGELRGGEALRVTKPVSPPRAPPLWARLKTMQTIVFGLKNAAGNPSAFFYIHPVDARPPAFFYTHPLDARPLPAFFYIIRWTPARSLCFFISIRWTPAPCVFLYPSGGRPPPAFFYIIRWTHARSGVPSTHHNLPFRNSFPRSPGGRCKAPPPPSVFMIRPSDETCPERGSARGKSGPRNSERFPPRRFPTL